MTMPFKMVLLVVCRVFFFIPYVYLRRQFVFLVGKAILNRIPLSYRRTWKADRSLAHYSCSCNLQCLVPLQWLCCVLGLLMIFLLAWRKVRSMGALRCSISGTDMKTTK